LGSWLSRNEEHPRPPARLANQLAIKDSPLISTQVQAGPGLSEEDAIWLLMCRSASNCRLFWAEEAMAYRITVTRAVGFSLGKTRRGCSVTSVTS